MSCAGIQKRMMAMWRSNTYKPSVFYCQFSDQCTHLVQSLFAFVARGGQNGKNSYGTRNLHKHLEKKYHDEYRRISCIDGRCEKVIAKRNAIVSVDVIIRIVICIRSRQSTGAAEHPQGNRCHATLGLRWPIMSHARAHRLTGSYLLIRDWKLFDHPARWLDWACRAKGYCYTVNV